MTNALGIYQQLKKQYDYMPDLIPGQLRVAQPIQIELQSYEQLEQSILDFNAISGWLCYQSNLVRYRIGDSLLSGSDGWILQGELCNGLSSCHIRQSAAGGWLVSIISDTSQEQQTGFIENVSFIAVPEHESEQKERLNYQVYWEPDEALGYRRGLSRFTGFSEDKEQQ